MAITPVSNNYDGFIFDGENSRDYGVYITDPAVFDAPARDVEMITIPGRNGTFARDNGRFENIKVTYHCAIGAENEADFVTAISNLRNMLASKIGYVILADEINTGEYRQAVFHDGLSVDTINKDTGTFDVVFECKPQRFLASGETPLTPASGDTVTNPTMFDAHPLIEVGGTGTIDINGDEIEVFNNPIGTVTLAAVNTNQSSDNPMTVDGLLLDTGDSISLNGVRYEVGIRKSGVSLHNVANVTISGMAGAVSGTTRSKAAVIIVDLSAMTFVKGTAKTSTATVGFTCSEGSVSFTITISYDGDSTFTFGFPVLISAGYIIGIQQYRRQPIIGESTKVAITGTAFIDLDIGEAWTENGGSVVSVNDSVSLPAVLPALKAGANVISYDNTITTFKMIPRWWCV